MKILSLVTHEFPFGPGEAFIASELPHLRAQFDAVIVAPVRRAAGDPRPLPEGVELDLGLSGGIPEGLSRPCALAAVACRRPAAALAALAPGSGMWSPAGLRSLVFDWRHAAGVRRWLHRLASDRPGCRICAYAYWLDGLAYGCALARRAGLVSAAASRTHRVDLYEDERVRPGRLPFLRDLDLILPVADHGVDYLRRRYQAPLRIELHRLGSSDPGGIAAASTDGVLRLVSVSRMVPFKRVATIATAAAHLARQGRTVEWHHLGDGPDMALVRSAAATAPSTLRCVLHGQTGHADVIGILRTGPFDALLSASSSEGVPVSMMEAMACGIPVATTAVGGVPELDPDGVAVELIGAEDGAEALAGATLRLIARGQQARTHARSTWERRWDAERNLPQLAQRLAGLP